LNSHLEHAVQEVLEAEVTRLAGTRYSRTGGQPGLVVNYLSPMPLQN
jgi:hypothetical protein